MKINHILENVIKMKVTVIKCDECGDLLKDEQPVYSPDDNDSIDLCYDCFDELYGNCTGCGTQYKIEDMVYIDDVHGGGYVCKDCKDELKRME